MPTTARFAGKRFEKGVQSVIGEQQLPWHSTHLGFQVEHWFQPTAPRDGSEANASVDGELVGYLHLAALNRGYMLTPFRSTALISPDTTGAGVDDHTQFFRECIEAIAG
jgi:glutamate-1-semialdehyde 2,1-aminomutase